MAENKVKYGIRNVHYAIATIAADGSATFGTFKAFPGARSISLEPQGENTPFYADDVEYWVGAANDGYEGDLEMALITEDFEVDVLGMILDNKKVVYEDKGAQAIHFALAFEFEGDQKATRHVLYNCTATRANMSGETTEDTIEPQTETVTISAASIYVPDLDKHIVKAKTRSDTDATAYSGWYTAVYVPTT